AVPRDRETVVPASGDTRDPCSARQPHLNRRGAVGVGTVSQLAIAVTAPSQHAAVGGQRDGVPETSGHLGQPNSGREVDLSRSIAMACRPVTQLTITIGAPAVSTVGRA